MTGGMANAGDHAAFVWLGVLCALVGLLISCFGARRAMRLVRGDGNLLWVYLAWALLLAGTLVWSNVGEPAASSFDDAGGANVARLVFLILGILTTMIIAAKRNLAFVDHLAGGVLGVFSVFALWGAASTTWSVLPAVTAYKSVEYLAALAVVGATLALISSRSVSKTFRGRLLRVKGVFDWYWLLTFGVLLSVYLGVLLQPTQALEPSIGLFSFQLQGVFPRIATNSVGELGAILAVVSLARLLHAPRAGRLTTWPLYALILVLSIVTLILAQSRSPILGCLLAFAVVAVADRRPWLLLAMGLLGAALAFGNGAATQEYLARGQDEAEIGRLSNRVDYWEGALGAIGERPVAGHGAYAGGRYLLEHEILGAENAVSSLHNSYMEVLVGTGFVGLAVFVAGLVAAWASLVALRRRAARYPVGRLLWVESLGVLTVLTVRSVFSTPFIWTNVLTFGLVLIFVSTLGGRLGRTEGGELARPVGAQPLPAARR